MFIFSNFVVLELKPVPDVFLVKFTGGLWCHTAIISHYLRRRSTSHHPADGNASRGRPSHAAWTRIKLQGMKKCEMSL